MPVVIRGREEERGGEGGGLVRWKCEKEGWTVERVPWVPVTLMTILGSSRHMFTGVLYPTWRNVH